MKMKPRFKKHFLKIFSVMLSLFLWVYVLNSERTSFEKNYNLKFILPEGLIFNQKPTQEISVQLNGPRAFIRNFLLQDDQLIVDLRKYNNGKSNFTVDLATIHQDLPFGMIIEKIIPRKLNIKLDKKVTKLVPLKLSSSDESSIRLNVKFSPVEVSVSGPKFLMNDLKSLNIRPIDFAILTQKKSIPVEAILPDERLILDSDEKLTAFLGTDESFFKMVLKKHPIKFLASNKKFKAVVKDVTAKVLIKDPTKSRSFISSSLQVWADIPENVKGRIEVPLRIIKEAEIENVEIFPNSIIVNIE